MKSPLLSDLFTEQFVCHLANKYKIKAIMFIGSGLEAVTNFTSLMSENMREDQAIQLIAFYGNQLVSKKEEKVVKPQIAQVQGKT